MILRPEKRTAARDELAAVIRYLLRRESDCQCGGHDAECVIGELRDGKHRKGTDND